MEKEKTMQKENWFLSVQDKLQGVSYPLDRSTAEEKLRGVSIGEEDVSRYLDTIEWPVDSQDELKEKLRWAMGSQGERKSSTGVPGLQ